MRKRRILRQQAQRFRMTPHVTAHIAAPWLDLEPMRVRICERGAHDLRSDAAVAYRGRHLGVMDAQHVAGARVRRHAQPAFYRCFEAMLGRVVANFDLLARQGS